jgi:membrane protein implicated in regulation of membrane protease activity
MRGQVISPISKKQLGEVKVDGKVWIAEADKKIPLDTYVTVVEIKEDKIKVEKDN